MTFSHRDLGLSLTSHSQVCSHEKTHGYPCSSEIVPSSFWTSEVSKVVSLRQVRNVYGKVICVVVSVSYVPFLKKKSRSITSPSLPHLGSRSIRSVNISCLSVPCFIGGSLPSVDSKGSGGWVGGAVEAGSCEVMVEYIGYTLGPSNADCGMISHWHLLLLAPFSW